jgi:hypothetical protein
VLASLRAESERAGDAGRLDDASALLDALVLDEEFADFLTIPGYAQLA